MERTSPIADWLGARIASALEDARRAADELVARGGLRPEEAAEIERAVGEALGQARRMVLESVVRPAEAAFSAAAAAWRRPPAGAAAPAPASSAASDTLLRRLDEVVARLERIERRLAADGAAGGADE